LQRDQTDPSRFQFGSVDEILAVVQHDLCLRSAEQLRVQIMAAFFCGFVYLDRTAVGFGVGVVPDTGHLPRDSPPRYPARYFETISRNLLRKV